MPKKDDQRTLTREGLQAIRIELATVYTQMQRPMVVLSSTGKDSSATVQVVLEMLLSLPPERRTQPVYIVSGDVGGGEMPQVRKRIYRTRDLINGFAAEHNLPVEAHVARPLLRNMFWVCLIGRGYAAPTARFAWCQIRLKIDPISRLVREEIIARHGTVVQVLGKRFSESSRRAQSMRKHAVPDSSFDFEYSPEFPGSVQYSPFRWATTKDIWWYLTTYPNPISALYNLQLKALYQEADNNKECPVTNDGTQPTCGGSRFGCFHCTVSKNSSLHSLVESPQYEWMWPLAEVHAYLQMTTDPAVKLIYREPKYTPSGRIKPLTRDPSRPTPGKYKLPVRRTILEMLLKAQEQCREEGPDPNLELISLDEIRAIRYLWLSAEAENRLREAANGPVSQKLLDVRVPAMIEQWYDHPELAPDDHARAIVERVLGLDIGPWSPDDARLLDKPAERHQSKARQMVMDLFGEQEVAA
jgi:DNA sulfur modification protein DndC